jgi:hypothetical protein
MPLVNMRGMTSLTFDTLKYADRLEKAGFTREQAKAEAEGLADVLSTGTQELATKGDLKAETSALRSEIDLLRKDMLASELRMTIKLGAFLSLAVGIIIAVLRVSH